MNDNTVLEVVLFRLKAEVDEAKFLAANRELQAKLETMEGYLRRELSRDQDGLWHDTVLWRSMEDAQRAGEIVMQTMLHLPAFGMMEQEGMQIFHFQRVEVFDTISQ